MAGNVPFAQLIKSIHSYVRSPVDIITWVAKIFCLEKCKISLFHQMCFCNEFTKFTHAKVFFYKIQNVVCTCNELLISVIKSLKLVLFHEEIKSLNLLMYSKHNKHQNYAHTMHGYCTLNSLTL